MPPPDPAHPLDNPAYSALTGPHAGFAEVAGRVRRYPTDVSPFFALPAAPTAQDWADAGQLAGAGTTFAVPGLDHDPPPDWAIAYRIPGVQLVAETVAGIDDADAVPLGPDDVQDMLALVERTKPGPFMRRTIELGSYLGIWHEGRLVAMAGERMHPPGWTEISAVCTDSDQRGRGLGTRLVLAVAAGIHRRGDTPFLHAAGDNVGAIRLYESLGFRLRRPITFVGLRVPERSVDS